MSKFWKFRDGMVSFAGAACVALTLGVLPAPAMAQTVAVDVSAADLSTLASQCGSEANCAVALQVLIRKLTALNPGVPLATIMGSVAVAVSGGYNAGTVPQALAINMLRVTANAATAQGLSTVAASISVALNQVTAGDPVDLQPIALGSASPA